MKILLLCSAGMSTSLLVTKMYKAAEQRGVEVEIMAHGASEGKRKLQHADIVLLGPQVRFMEAEINKAVQVPVQVIDMRAYGMMDGAKVLDDALQAVNEAK